MEQETPQNKFKRPLTWRHILKLILFLISLTCFITAILVAFSKNFNQYDKIILTLILVSLEIIAIMASDEIKIE